MDGIEHLTLITTREEAMIAWDRRSVIVKDEDGCVYVYPMIGRGYCYPGFDLQREACLQVFNDLRQAQLWAAAQGYTYYTLGGV